MYGSLLTAKLTIMHKFLTVMQFERACFFAFKILPRFKKSKNVFAQADNVIKQFTNLFA